MVSKMTDLKLHAKLLPHTNLCAQNIKALSQGVNLSLKVFKNGAFSSFYDGVILLRGAFASNFQL
jgi:hypothetical protein